MNSKFIIKEYNPVDGKFFLITHQENKDFLVKVYTREIAEHVVKSLEYIQTIPIATEAEKNLDQMFLEAFTNANHPALLDWVSVKFELKRLRKIANEH